MSDFNSFMKTPLKQDCEKCQQLYKIKDDGWMDGWKYKMDT